MAASGKRKTPVPKEVGVKQLSEDLKSLIGQWQELGFYLSVDTKAIMSQSVKSPRVCFIEVIKLWLHEDGVDRKWKVIFEALQDDYGKLASELEETYQPDSNVDLDAQDLVELLTQVTPRWFDFGIKLDIDFYVLEEIKADKGPECCFDAVIAVWLRKKDAHFEQLCKALEGVRNKKLARKIREKYIDAIPVTDVTSQVELWYANVNDTTLNEDDHLYDVLRAVNKVVKWVELGLSLGLPKSMLDHIELDCSKTEQRRLEMLTQWFRNPREGRDPSWLNLCLALADGTVGEVTLARKIAQEHKKGMNKGSATAGANTAGPPQPGTKPLYSAAELEDGSQDTEQDTQCDSTDNSDNPTTSSSVPTTFDDTTLECVEETPSSHDHANQKLVLSSSKDSQRPVISTTSKYPMDPITDSYDKIK